MGRGTEGLGKANNKGFLQYINSLVQHDRLGELLVRKGILKRKDLRLALNAQKTLNMPLGEVLICQNSASRYEIQKALFSQFLLRNLATLTLFTAAVMGFGLKKVKAGSIQDVPAKIAISATQDFHDVAYYPELFESSEKRSNDLKAFTKWTGMFDQFEKSLSTSTAQKVINDWKKELNQYKSMPLKSMAKKVNDFVNEQRYITDSRNWGKSDYWATPVEFIQRGGDCEDFAIAKYTALRVLGVPENRLRVAIVHDNIKDIPHAVLVIYTNQGPYILDNQIKTLVDGNRLNRYRPIFSINREAWWLHSNPKRTVLASVE